MENFAYIILVTDLLKPSAVRKTYSLDFISSDGKLLLLLTCVTWLMCCMLRG